MIENFPTTDPTWDLDPIFEGGLESASFFETLKEVEGRLRELGEALEGLEIVDPEGLEQGGFEGWRAFFDAYFELAVQLRELRAYSGALAVTNTDNPQALRMPSHLDGATTALGGLRVELLAKFRGLDDEVFEAFLGDERFERMNLWLKELRRDADQAMDPALEALLVELNRDGLHAWGRLYDDISARLRVRFEVDGEEREMSVGQAQNIARGHQRREVRRAAFEGLKRAWSEIAPICASTLNSKVGIEQTLYNRRGGDCLTMALQENRVERQTVEAIFEAAAEFRPLLVRYLKAKARLLGLEKLEWYDVFAPVGGDGPQEEISYEEAQEFIVEQVESFSPKIADFCRMALAKQWVEVEDRPGKAQGGYCTSLPKTKEVRIFMTYGGTSDGVATLAHELGHGYHFWVMRDLPQSELNVPMGLAETASTLLEALVEQAALKLASGERRLELLDERLGRAVSFLMDIPARYNLELAMHEARAKGALHEELLTELTEDAFTESFGGALGSVDGLFWASKLHFYITGLPFYNFPYTFGYLFSRAVYEKARGDESFIGELDGLLRDTGRMSSEELGERYLGADLKDREFWKEAAGSLASDIEEFEALAAQRE